LAHDENYEEEYEAEEHKERRRAYDDYLHRGGSGEDGRSSGSAEGKQKKNRGRDLLRRERYPPGYHTLL
jgi:hypothetical protein